MGAKEEIVVLLHGIGRTAGSMSAPASRLAEKGYAISNIDYPSRSASIATLAEGVNERLQAENTEAYEKLHFVTHSMGGLIVRQLIKDSRPPNLGRTLMLAPPNQGSAVADFWGNNFLFKAIYGPAGQDLQTGNGSFGPVDFSLGVVAGTKSIDPISSLLLDGPNDGKVTVESTKVEGMADHIVLPVNHTFLMRDARVLRQIEAFLGNGTFTPQSKGEPV
ncbi:alpha/beta hydrolase [Parvibaculaceae bacterium PLY_AMNH_Bact1]|nr:alpha/beta hydrolase [Parvibaculaceae bacterium PLY_AMNH_Bact1]